MAEASTSSKSVCMCRRSPPAAAPPAAPYEEITVTAGPLLRDRVASLRSLGLGEEQERAYAGAMVAAARISVSVEVPIPRTATADMYVNCVRATLTDFAACLYRPLHFRGIDGTDLLTGYTARLLAHRLVYDHRSHDLLAGGHHSIAALCKYTVYAFIARDAALDTTPDLRTQWLAQLKSVVKDAAALWTKERVRAVHAPEIAAILQHSVGQMLLHGLMRVLDTLARDVDVGVHVRVPRLREAEAAEAATDTAKDMEVCSE